jgi:hypothetical protein
LIDNDGEVTSRGSTGRTNTWVSVPATSKAAKETKSALWDRDALIVLPFNRPSMASSSLLVQVAVNEGEPDDVLGECANWLRDVVTAVESHVWDAETTPSDDAYAAAAASKAATRLVNTTGGSSSVSMDHEIMRRASVAALTRVRMVRQRWDVFDVTGIHLRGVLEVEVGVEHVAEPPPPRRRASSIGDAGMGEHVPGERQRAMGIVVVRVLNGTELPNRELFGQQDPYVKMQLSRRAPVKDAASNVSRHRMECMCVVYGCTVAIGNDCHWNLRSSDCCVC